MIQTWRSPSLNLPIEQSKNIEAKLKTVWTNWARLKLERLKKVLWSLRQEFALSCTKGSAEWLKWSRSTCHEGRPCCRTCTAWQLSAWILASKSWQSLLSKSASYYALRQSKWSQIVFDLYAIAPRSVLLIRYTLHTFSRSLLLTGLN